MSFSHWLVDYWRGFEETPFNRYMMIDGMPNRPLYIYQKDIIDLKCVDWF